MIPGVSIISGKVSATSVNGAGRLGLFWDPSKGCRGRGTPRNFLCSKLCLDWLKIDFTVVEIITIQDYKHTHKKKANVTGSTHIQC